MMGEPGRILGIDYGARRVGLALSDPLQIIAQGAGTVENSPDLTHRLASLIAERAVVAVVVGMPYVGDGEVGARAREVGAFVRSLRSAVTVPVEVQDESYTSVEAQRAHIAGGMKRSTRREKGRVDEMAARLILQEYLDHRSGR